MTRDAAPDTVAVITDIHGNLPSLHAALARIDELGIETVYCGGDLVGYGPHPNEVCELIAQREIPTIYGNEVDIHLVHGSPRKVNEYLFEDKPARLYERLATAETDPVLVFGHTHKPWVHEYGGVLFVNCGSVGKPKDGDPRGAFAVLTANADGVEVTIERVPYDADMVAAEVRAVGLPGEFADKLLTDALAYLPAQVAGCTLGAVAANGMFSLAAISISTHHRASPAHLFSEVIATAGLLLVIFSLARSKRANAIPAAVGAYIGAAYFFTSSASFANPAISIGRIFSNTFAGIAPMSVAPYVVAQLVGGACAVLVLRVLYPGVTPAEAAEVMLPHGDA